MEKMDLSAVRFVPTDLDYQELKNTPPCCDVCFFGVAYDTGTVGSKYRFCNLKLRSYEKEYTCDVFEYKALHLNETYKIVKECERVAVEKKRLSPTPIQLKMDF